MRSRAGPDRWDAAASRWPSSRVIAPSLQATDLLERFDTHPTWTDALAALADWLVTASGFVILTCRGIGSHRMCSVASEPVCLKTPVPVAPKARVPVDHRARPGSTRASTAARPRAASGIDPEPDRRQRPHAPIPRRRRRRA